MRKLFYVVLGGLLFTPSLALAQKAMMVQGPKLPGLKMDSFKVQVTSLDEYLQKQAKVQNPPVVTDPIAIRTFYQLVNLYPQQSEEIINVATAYMDLEEAVANGKKEVRSLQEKLLDSYAALAQKNTEAAAAVKAFLQPQIKTLSQGKATNLNGLARLVYEEEELAVPSYESTLPMYE